jgi:Eukaryotic aspartyl protease
MLVDNTSSDFYVPFANCTIGGCAGRETLGPKDPTSLNVTKQTFSIGGGSVSGIVVEDTLNLAGFTIPKMSIGGATVYSSTVNLNVLICAYALTIALGWEFGTWVTIRWKSERISFGYGSIGASLLVFWPKRLMNQLSIANSQFGLYLKPTADLNGGTGEIRFGSPNTDLFTGTLNEVPNVSDGAWEAPVVPPLS